MAVRLAIPLFTTQGSSTSIISQRPHLIEVLIVNITGNSDFIEFETVPSVERRVDGRVSYNYIRHVGSPMAQP